MAALLLACSVSLGGCGSAVQQGHLFIEGAAITIGIDRVGPHEPLFYEFNALDLRPEVHGVVQLTGLRFRDASKGFAILKSGAGRFSELPPGGGGEGANRGGQWAELLLPLIHPISSVVLDPSCPASARCHQPTEPGRQPAQDWYLIVEMQISSSGTYKAGELVLTYSNGGQQMEQILPYSIKASTGDG